MNVTLSYLSGELVNAKMQHALMMRRSSLRSECIQNYKICKIRVDRMEGRVLYKKLYKNCATKEWKNDMFEDKISHKER